LPRLSAVADCTSGNRPINKIPNVNLPIDANDEAVQISLLVKRRCRDTLIGGPNYVNRLFAFSDMCQKDSCLGADYAASLDHTV
jgi:hypothetical protein